MSKICHSNASGAVRHGSEGAAVAPGMIRWLSFAAAPTFAIMALLAAMAGSGPLDSLCSGAASPIGGMVPMYLLMSAFHSVPWLNLIAAGVGKSPENATLGAGDVNLKRTALLNGTRLDEVPPPNFDIRRPPG